MPTIATHGRMALQADALPCVRASAQAARAPRDPTILLLGLIVVLSAIGFGLGVGHPSLFIDEVYSWEASRGSLGDLANALQYNEVTPPLYYLILHGWMQLAGDSELMLRLPSVAAGIALVGALYWLGSLVAGRHAGLITAALAAVSPLVLLYAQQVRAYVFVMLALTITVAAVLQATRDRSARWLLVAAAGAAAAVFLHYTASLVLAPLAVWFWLQPNIELRWRAGLCAAVALPLAAVIPLALEQASQGHHDEFAHTYASLTMFNALRIAGSPFDGRATGGLMLARELGAVVVVEVLALLALADRFRPIRARRLIVACAATPLVAVLLASALGQPIALTRYTAVAVPFVLVAIAAVAVRLQRPLAALLLAAALAASGIGLHAAQRDDGQNPDTRAAIARIADDWRAGDTVVSVGLLGFDGALSYYGDKLLDADVQGYPSLDKAARAPRVVASAVDGGRVWIVSDPVLSRPQLAAALRTLDLAPVYTRTFTGNAPVQVVRAEVIR